MAEYLRQGHEAPAAIARRRILRREETAPVSGRPSLRCFDRQPTSDLPGRRPSRVPASPRVVHSPAQSRCSSVLGACTAPRFTE
jgi:hypothetical protein